MRSNVGELQFALRQALESLAVAKGNVGELQFASEETSERAVRFLRRGLSDSVFSAPPWFIKKNILTNDLRLLYLTVDCSKIATDLKLLNPSLRLDVTKLHLHQIR